MADVENAVADEKAALLTEPVANDAPLKPRYPITLLVTVLLWTAALGVYCSCSIPSSFRATSFGAKTKLPIRSVAADAAVVATSPTRDFQVYPPILVPQDGKVVLSNGSGVPYQTEVAYGQGGCVTHQTLMVHQFANSYGNPFVGSYTPPKCSFNRVVANITVTSQGVQFDRLGSVYFGDTEIWRTTTAEPSSNGIIWTYLKDMSNFVTLFNKPQTLIFDLGNIVDSTYTGPYNVTLTAVFFNSEDTIQPADEIIPISARLGSQGMSSTFTVPQQNASNSLTLPQNVRKAVCTIAATGQSNEEFWYTNVFSSAVDTFPGVTLYGYSPFREVQLFIDGELAGVVWPFPVIFTGGIVPGFWRPIVGIDAFDLREDEIDITPWLPLLCDGKSHTFQIKVAGVNDNGKKKGEITETVGNFWLVTGKIFLWLDPAGSVTTGSKVSRSVPVPSIQLSQKVMKDKTGTNETLVDQINVARQLSISSTIHTANGSQNAVWSQNLTYSNFDNTTSYGNVQILKQTTDGYDFSSGAYARHISYPIDVNSTYMSNSASFTILASLLRGQTIQIIGEPVFPSGIQAFAPLPRVKASYPAFQGSNLQTTQNGTAAYTATDAGSTSNGTTAQNMTFSGVQAKAAPSGKTYPQVRGSQELYQRSVTATDGVVTYDQESLVLQPIRRSSRNVGPDASTHFAAGSPLKLLGKGLRSNVGGL